MSFVETTNSSQQDGAYNLRAEEFRSNILNFINGHGATGEPLRWLYYDFMTEQDNGEGGTLFIPKEVVVYAKYNDSELPTPTLRIISNESHRFEGMTTWMIGQVRMPFEGTLQWLVKDMILDADNDAWYDLGVVNSQDDSHMTITHAPLFFVSEGDLKFTCNTRLAPDIRSIVQQGESNLTGRIEKVFPLGGIETVDEKLDALDVLATALKELEDQIPVSVSASTDS